MAKFKVGDKVIGNKLANKYGITVEGWIGYVNKVLENNQIAVYRRRDKDGMTVDAECFDLYEGEPSPEPTPKPTPIEVNITVNLYENACWYCRKGGVVDLYLNGAMGICPSCKRVCNNTTPFKLEHKGKGVYTAPKKPKKNEPLTVEELKALPVGTKVYIVWCWDMRANKKGKPSWDESGWGVKEEKKVTWKSPDCDNNWQEIEDADRCFDAYLEEPERPREDYEELPF